MLKVLLLPVLAPLILLTGCPPETPTLPLTTGNGGWIIETVYIGLEGIALAPDTTVSGVWKSDGVNAAGSASPFTVTTESVTGLAVVPNGRVPAVWGVTWVGNSEFPQCTGVTATATPNIAGALEEFQCYSTVAYVVNPYQFQPNPLLLSAPPAESTITGAGFSSAYGMPVVQYFDSNGNFVDQVSATTVSSDGTSISAPTPNLTGGGVVVGTYAGLISNIKADGSYQSVGAVSVNVLNPSSYTPCGHQKSCTPTETISAQ